MNMSGRSKSASLMRRARSVEILGFDLNPDELAAELHGCYARWCQNP